MSRDAGIAPRLAADRRAVETELRRRLAAARGTPARLRRAMAHALFGGGKRVRPLLLLWCRDACRAAAKGRTASRAHAVAAAAAVEMIHTYSLVHDDLPAMDDDVLRRGRPTCHVAFDEATAILAGDALQALAFETLAGVPRHGTRLVELVARAAGPAGMVGGQVLDMQAAGAAPSPAMVRRIHLGKTARLIAAPLVAGGVLGGAGSRRLAALERAGLDLGLAFQAVDDVLDATATTEQLGKTAGKDARDGKVTLVTAAGVEYAARRAARLGRRAERTLAETLPDGPARARLLELARRLWRRNR